MQPFLSLLHAELYPSTPWNCSRNMLLEELIRFVTVPDLCSFAEVVLTD